MTRYHATAEGNIPFTPDEELEADQREAEWLAGKWKRDVLVQIQVLESQVTPRRIREAVRGSGKAWLDALDAQIAALRSQL